MIERLFNNKKIRLLFKNKEYSKAEKRNVRKGLPIEPVEKNENIPPELHGAKFQSRDPDYSPVNYSHIMINSRYIEYLKAALNGLSTGSSAEKIMKTLDEVSEKTFVDVLLDRIAERNVKDSQIYRAAHIDRRLFSKIISNRMYKPSRDTCILLCLAVHLSLSEAKDLLSRAGYTLTHANKRDIIIEYFFKEKIYNIDSINEILYDLGFKTLTK